VLIVKPTVRLLLSFKGLFTALTNDNSLAVYHILNRRTFTRIEMTSRKNLRLSPISPNYLIAVTKILIWLEIVRVFFKNQKGLRISDRKNVRLNYPIYISNRKARLISHKLITKSLLD